MDEVEKNINPDELVIEPTDPDVVEPGVNADTETETVETKDEPEEKPEEKPEESTDTETETADDPEKPVDEYQKRFDELGLSRQYTSAAEALERVPDTNRYLDSLEKANKAQQQEIGRLQAIEKGQLKPRPTAEELAQRLETDPEGAIADAGFVRTENLEAAMTRLDQVELRQRQQDIAGVISQYPELESIASAYRVGREPVVGTNKLWDAMNQKIKDYPGLETAPYHTILAVLYPLVKEQAAVKVPPVTKIPGTKKEEATTTGGASRLAASDQPDYSTMSTEEIYQDYQKRGMIGT